jgi:hypothetical protein
MSDGADGVGGTGADHVSDSVKTPPGCARCGVPLVARPRGRDLKFCSARCRSAAYQDRRAALLTELGGLVARAADILREFE